MIYDNWMILRLINIELNVLEKLYESRILKLFCMANLLDICLEI